MKYEQEGLALATTVDLDIEKKAGFELMHKGKVRETYSLGKEKSGQENYLIVTTDRISVFDFVLSNPIPGKGIVLSQISNMLMRMFGNIVPNHLIETNVENFPQRLAPWKNVLRNRAVIVKKLHMLPVEDIVRGNLGGSVWKDYLAGKPVGGHALAPGMKLWQKLPQPIYTPSTKAEAGAHDENITRDSAQDILKNDFGFDDAMVAFHEATALNLFAGIRDYAAACGVAMLDTKFEFGLDALSGELTLGDECGTPDSSRYSTKEAYDVAFAAGKNPDSLDKQPVRDYMEAQEKAGLWNKSDMNSVPPALPNEKILETAERYAKAFFAMGAETFNPGAAKQLEQIMAAARKEYAR